MRKWINLLEGIAEDMIAEPRSTEQSPSEELASIRSQLADFKARHDELVRSFREPNFYQRKEQFLNDVGDRWSELVDREWELMKNAGETGQRRSLKEFFNQ